MWSDRNKAIVFSKQIYSTIDVFLYWKYMFMKPNHIANLGNAQLGRHYDATHKKLENIKEEILEDITNILWHDPDIDNATYMDTPKFYEYCSTFEAHIGKEKKDLYAILITKEINIKEEMKTRQKKMLKEIDITTPSMRVRMIAEEMRWEYFEMFDIMINYVKRRKQWKWVERPEDRELLAPKTLRDIFETRMNNAIVNILENNEWPLSN